MMEDARAVLAAERGRTSKVNPSDPPKGEPMGDLHVGDVYQEIAKPSPTGALTKLALGGALLASGVGAGVAVPLLLDAMADKAPPAVEQPEYVDRDTQYRLGFGVPKPKGGS